MFWNVNTRVWTNDIVGMNTPSGSGSVDANIAASIGIHCGTWKSVPDPFQSEPKRQNFKAAAAAAARCVHGLRFNPNHVVRMKLYDTRVVTVVDSGFPKEGHQWGGELTYYSIWHAFCHKLHENEKKTEIRGNARKGYTPSLPDPPLSSVSCQRSQ